jgi:hypothetical protein
LIAAAPATITAAPVSVKSANTNPASTNDSRYRLATAASCCIDDGWQVCGRWHVKIVIFGGNNLGEI